MDKELYKKTWEVMSASNNSAVAHFLSREVVPAIRKELDDGEFHGAPNGHPLYIIIADKILDLACKDHRKNVKDEMLDREQITMHAYCVVGDIVHKLEKEKADEASSV